MVSVTSLNIAEKEIDITNVMDIILSCWNLSSYMY
jgi:hypothetical protein